LREGKRPGSEKRSKTASLVIHEERVVAPAEPVPEGSRFKGYCDVVVQNLVSGPTTRAIVWSGGRRRMDAP
jgi:hypothetical protein